MRFTLVAVAAGLLIGALAGGRPSRLAAASFRLWPALAAGLVLQVAGAPLSGRSGTAVLVASYVLLLAFAAANCVRVGMWMVALGIGLNLVVIAVNGGMPVRPSAVVAAGIVEPWEVAALHIEGKRHLERPSDRLTGLGDVIPVPALGEVLSFGDLVMAVGLADVLVHLLLPPRRGAHAASGPPAGPRRLHASRKR